MKLTDIYKEINKAYATGCVEYYASFSPNRWQDAHDTLERALLQPDRQLVLNHLAIFRGTILNLIKDYKAIQQRTFFSEY